MTVVVTPLSGSEKLRLREVFTSVQDSGSLSGYICIDSRSVSKLESFVMENGLLDRVEDNANVHRWSEQTQLEKGDSIAARWALVPSPRSVLEPSVQLFHFWGGRLGAYRRGVHCLVTLSQGLILTYPDETKRVDVFALSLYGLMVFPRALGYVDKATTDLFHRFSKRITSIPVILAETFRSLGTCRKAGAGRFVGCAQLLLAWFYSHFRLIDKVVCRVFFEDYSPLKDIVASTRRFRLGPFIRNWGAIGYAPLLVLRQFGLRQFVPGTHGLTQSEFAYRGADYKKRRGRRINDNIPEPNAEGAQPMEEYLQVMPSELEIMKQEFERKIWSLRKG
ncbi:hypothetical protein CXB51_036841 [Gossypium anomalum]|uniref:DUF7745 domain-containing protein n=1 Tax=Gossypium anomalum TaxID=47600 RepID=A0A8J6CGP4_9ROSI|nr:hypothetical protein CXB51_036841 [Gossypium anomalum]